MTFRTGIHLRHFGILIVPLVLLCFCGQKSNPVSFVDSYGPALTSPKGTAFSGDYYPLVTGYSWTMGGTLHEQGSAAVTQGSSTQTQKLDTNVDLSIAMTVLPACTLQLSGSPVPVIPLQAVSNSNDPLAGSTMTQFYQSGDTAILVKASKTPTSDSIIEVKNGEFLKKPLVAGDAWVVEPDPNYTAILQSMAGNPSIKIDSSTISVDSKKIVVGAEKKTMFGGQHDMVRVDQVFDISISMSISDPTNANNKMAVTERITGTMKMHLVKDTGEAMEDEDLTVTESMKGVSDGVAISDDESISTVGTVMLVSFSTGSAALPKKQSVAGKLPETFVEKCRAIARGVAILVR
jgi:hypothetical protein